MKQLKSKKKSPRGFKPCGEGANICNCKKKSECGYLIMAKGFNQLKPTNDAAERD